MEYIIMANMLTENCTLIATHRAAFLEYLCKLYIGTRTNTEIYIYSSFFNQPTLHISQTTQFFCYFSPVKILPVVVRSFCLVLSVHSTHRRIESFACCVMCTATLPSSCRRTFLLVLHHEKETLVFMKEVALSL